MKANDQIPVGLNPAGIPSELQERPQWVLWTWPGKVPINPATMKRAKTTEPGTWGSFDQALEVCQAHRGNGVGGVGFVFTPGDLFCGVDLDGCRDAESGEIEPWAMEIIKRVNSYTEISPSGTGAHIILKGTLPGEGRSARQGAGKVRLRGERFFYAMTGRHLEGTPATIEGRAGELSGLYFETYTYVPHGRPWKGDPRGALRAIKELLAESPNFSGTVTYTALVRRIMLIQACSISTAKDTILAAAKRPYRYIEKAKGGKGWRLKYQRYKGTKSKL
jgi:hypothetical protein